MSEKKKSTPKKTETKESKPAPSASKEGSKNGKGDSPRNCFSDSYLSNFDSIDWSK